MVISSWPFFDDHQIATASKVLASGQVNTWTGEETRSFEQEFALWCGSRHAIALANGSLALSAAYLAVGLGRGDELITTPRTFIATASSAVLLGAKPVFCDVEEQTLCLDTNKLKKLISKKTKAIIAVDYSGNIANYEKIKKIKNKKIRVIQDAAHSFASSFKGKRIGSFGDIVMFSFDPIKTITCIDGGAIVVKNLKELKKLKSMRQLGFEIQPNVAFNNIKKKKI